MRVTCSYQGKETAVGINKETILISRPNGIEVPDLDLSPDIYVSRQHALLYLKHGACWIKDIGSRFGTKVNGREIKHEGEWRLFPVMPSCSAERLYGWTFRRSRREGLSPQNPPSAKRQRRFTF